MYKRQILPYTKNVLCCDIHTRRRSQRRLLAAGAEKVLLLSDLMTAPVDGSGYNEQYGLLGSNKATEDSVKLFPRDCQAFVNKLADSLRKATGKQIEAMIYGDGAFKDPMGKIWELADPDVYKRQEISMWTFIMSPKMLKICLMLQETKTKTKNSTIQ